MRRKERPVRRELAEERQKLLELGGSQRDIAVAMEVFQRASRYAPVVPPPAAAVRYSTSSNS